MDIDILAALNASPSRGPNRCGAAKFIDDIPADTPGRDELARLFETPHTHGSQDTRSAQNMALVLNQLGLPYGPTPILDHRNHACRCYR